MTASVPARRDGWRQPWATYAALASHDFTVGTSVTVGRHLLDLPICGRPSFHHSCSGLEDVLVALGSDRPQVESVGLKLSRTGIDIAPTKTPAERLVQRDSRRPIVGVRSLEGHAARLPTRALIAVFGRVLLLSLSLDRWEWPIAGAARVPAAS